VMFQSPFERCKALQSLSYYLVADGQWIYSTASSGCASYHSPNQTLCEQNRQIYLYTLYSSNFFSF
jgi:phospholipase C